MTSLVLNNWAQIFSVNIVCHDDDDEFGFNDVSTSEGHLHENGILIWAQLFKASLA